MRGALLRVEGRSRSRSAAWVCTVLEVCGRSGLLALAGAGCVDAHAIFVEGSF